MRLRALGYFTGVVGLMAARFPERLNPCPEGRTLERQLKHADVVVLGEITYDSDCRPSDKQSSRAVLVDCVGHSADVLVTQSWKGPAKVGHVLALSMPAPGGSASLLMRKGETHVVFARLVAGSQAPEWYAETSACMLPAGETASDSTLVKELNLWHKSKS